MKKQKWLKRGLMVFLAMVLMAGIFPTSVAQQASKEDAISQIVSEEVSLREDSSKRFLCEDGSFIVAAYGSPVHFRDDGAWKEIDNSLVLNGKALSASGKASYTPKASALTVSIPQDLSNGQQVKVSNKGYTFGFGVSTKNRSVNLQSAATLVDVEKTPSAIALQQDAAQETSAKSQGKLSKAEQIQEKNAKIMAVDNLSSAVVYKGMFPSADLEYIVLPDRIKENIVVTKPQSEYTYRFDVSMDGLTAIPQENGSILLVETVNPTEAVFLIEAPYMYDANGDTSYNVKMSLEQSVLRTCLASRQKHRNVVK